MHICKLVISFHNNCIGNFIRRLYNHTSNQSMTCFPSSKTSHIYMSSNCIIQIISKNSSIQVFSNLNLSGVGLFLKEFRDGISAIDADRLFQALTTEMVKNLCQPVLLHLIFSSLYRVKVHRVLLQRHQTGIAIVKTMEVIVRVKVAALWHGLFIFYRSFASIQI